MAVHLLPNLCIIKLNPPSKVCEITIIVRLKCKKAQKTRKKCKIGFLTSVLHISLAVELIWAVKSIY
jgi:hypothetical protein